MKRFYLSKLFFPITVLLGMHFGAAAQTTTFNHTGGPQTYTVPPGITLISISASGAAGGNALDLSQTCHTGGKGSTATGTLTVTPGQVLNVYVGGSPVSPGTTSFNGGASGGMGTASCASAIYGGGGGGASDVRTSASLSDRVIVAGGGGGSGSGYTNCGALGAGGSGGGGDMDGSAAYNCGQGYPGSGVNFGKKGMLTSTANNGTADGGGSNVGVSGTLGVGGTGAPGQYTVAGGGGGGGYYGGGGGGGAGNGSGVGGGGGGGGSSYIGGVTSGVITPNVNTGSGRVIITVLCAAPGAVVGPTSTCVGQTIALSNPTGPSGTWVSSNPSVATVNSSGSVTGIAAGTATITHSISNPCGGIVGYAYRNN